jgi:hypothetical protein
VLRCARTMMQHFALRDADPYRLVMYGVGAAGCMGANWSVPLLSLSQFCTCPAELLDFNSPATLTEILRCGSMANQALGIAVQDQLLHCILTSTAITQNQVFTCRILLRGSCLAL